MKLTLLFTSVRNIFLICVFLGIIASIYSYYKYHPFIKKQEQQISLIDKINLYIIRAIHYTMVFLQRVYPLFVELSIMSEIYAIIIIFLIFLHWKYFGECVFSIAEKKILDKSYIGGSKPRYEPFLILLNQNPAFYDGLQKTNAVIPCLIILRFLYALYI